MTRLRTDEELFDDAMQNIPLNKRNDIKKGGMNDFLEDLVESFYVEKIKEFPKLCEETRVINLNHLKELHKYGNKSATTFIGGKVYEGTTGWSKDGLFKHKWIIPLKLKFFMRNLIYVDFWDDENAKVRDKFMKGILKGEDPLKLLAQVRANYGSDVNPTIEKESNG